MLRKIGYIIMIALVIKTLFMGIKEIIDILKDNQPLYSKVIMSTFITFVTMITCFITLGFGSYCIDGGKLWMLL